MSRAVLLAAIAFAACAPPAKRPAEACGALGDPATAAAPFYERGNVYAARPVTRVVSRTKAFENRRIAGAELSMRATPGMTPELLQRALSCHASSAAASEHPNDPLRPRGDIEAIDVRSSGAGFVVVVTSNDEATASDIWDRSRAFAVTE